MQYQVPQFIETEDKLVGGILSLKQFAYFGGAGLISAGLYLTASPWVWIFVTAILGGIAAAFAFLKINGRPLISLLISAVNFYRKPQMYVWQSEKQDLPNSTKVESGGGLERILQGMALKSTWRRLQTGTKTEDSPAPTPQGQAEEHYQVFRRATGELNAARRVDYR